MYIKQGDCPTGMPDFVIALDGASGLKIPSSEYLTPYGNQCLLRVNDGGNGKVANIFGDVLMRNYYVAFDQENLRVGFATPATSDDNSKPKSLIGQLKNKVNETLKKLF